MPFRGRGGFRGAAFSMRGGAFGARGGFGRGGFGGGGGFAAGANAAPVGYGAGNGNGFGGGGGYGNNYGASAAPTAPAAAPAATSGLKPLSAEPNEQILVRNVSGCCPAQFADAQLPWSTSNEDLVELFETVGNVALAEILFEGEQSKGEGIVQFTETAEAQQAGDRFMGYLYGGRPLGEHAAVTPLTQPRRPVQPPVALVWRLGGAWRRGRAGSVGTWHFVAVAVVYLLYGYVEWQLQSSICQGGEAPRAISCLSTPCLRLSSHNL